MIAVSSLVSLKQLWEYIREIDLWNKGCTLVVWRIEYKAGDIFILRDDTIMM